MSRVIEILRQDHVNMSQLLDLLERQLSIFDAGQSPDYEIIQSVIEYCLNYPDLKHHPLEDLVLRKLRAKGTPLEAAVENLLEEHESLSRQTRRVAAAVNGVLREAELPRESFVQRVREFIKFYREHIEKENRYFFPAALAALDSQDWADIEGDIPGPEDPLFGTATDERFQALRQSVLQWDREGLEPR